MITFLKVSVLGIITAAAAVLIEQLLAVFVSLVYQQEIVLGAYSRLGLALVAFAIIEELLKYLAIRFALRDIFKLRGLGFVLSSALIGLWWGLFESFLVVFSNPGYFSGARNAEAEIMFSLLAITLIHLLTATFMGIMISSRAAEAKVLLPRAIILPLLSHLLFNFLIIQKGNFTNWLVAIELAVICLTDITIFISNRRHLD